MLFSGLFLPLLLVLGIWQLQRAEFKQQQQGQWQQQMSELAWPQLVEQGLDAGRPVKLNGSYGDTTWLLDNRTRDGMAGYEVLTVFYPLQGPALVVNRGWVIAPRTRQQLPDSSVTQEQVEISGRLADFPQPPVLAASEASSGWPRRVQSLPPEIAQDAVPELPRLILRLADQNQPGALRADWAPDRMAIATHYGYATQWFALALMLTVLTIVASYRKTAD
ncbi:MAG: SURF1 family protein [Marinobacter sp.]|nr:SURF1 family protein [Marinobacter sp.]UQG58302.1 SURF1 family protein [Marinobacter sp. M4C]UQG67111.1 SURF1 family protein [Marinobacter sp. M2C]UQG71389.1 SURF1 family protein [Marinobacter sp. M1C]MCL1481208.1 SURF1 family protein [Marinobacter sp.]